MNNEGFTCEWCRYWRHLKDREGYCVNEPRETGAATCDVLIIHMADDSCGDWYICDKLIKTLTSWMAEGFMKIPFTFKDK